MFFFHIETQIKKVCQFYFSTEFIHFSRKHLKHRKTIIQHPKGVGLTKPKDQGLKIGIQNPLQNKLSEN